MGVPKSLVPTSNLIYIILTIFGRHMKECCSESGIPKGLDMERKILQTQVHISSVVYPQNWQPPKWTFWL